MPNSIFHSITLSWYSALCFVLFHLVPISLSLFFLPILCRFTIANDYNKFIIRNYVGLFHFISILFFFSLFLSYVALYSSQFLIHAFGFRFVFCSTLRWFDTFWINKMVLMFVMRFEIRIVIRAQLLLPPSLMMMMMWANLVKCYFN